MGQSLYKIFEKVLVPDGIEEAGDIKYKYNTDVTFELIAGVKPEEVIHERV